MAFENLPPIFTGRIDGYLYGACFPPDPWVHILNEACDKFDLAWKRRVNSVVDHIERHILIICETQEEADACIKMLYPRGRDIDYLYEGFPTQIRILHAACFPSKGTMKDLILYPSSWTNIDGLLMMLV